MMSRTQLCAAIAFRLALSLQLQGEQGSNAGEVFNVMGRRFAPVFGFRLRTKKQNIRLFSEPSKRVVSPLRNFGDVMFTAEINIGGQNVSAVVDSGSFDLIVLSAQCGNACGPEKMLYNEKKSSTFKGGDLTTKQAYGSGTTESQESWETVAVENSIVADNQVFWKAIGSDMTITTHGNFQAILGVGPPESAIIMAQWALEDAQRFMGVSSTLNLLELPPGTQNLSLFQMPEYLQYFTYRNLHKGFHIFAEGIGGGNADDRLEYYKKILNHAKKEKSFVEHSGVKVLSICLHKESGGDGVFVWNDYEPSSYPAGTFQSIRNVGDIYWSAPLENVKIGDEIIGCQDAACSGVVDTGTSLISVPLRVGQYVEMLVSHLEDCNDIASLPNLEFTLGGQALSLPPESYVGYVNDVGGLLKEMRPLMPQLALRENSSREGTQNCRSLLMTSASVGPNGEEWIIGVPLFRKYYTTFQFNDDWKPDTMHFSEAGSECQPRGSAALRAMPGLSKEVKDRGKNVLTVDAAKLRGPTAGGYFPVRRDARNAAR